MTRQPLETSVVAVLERPYNLHPVFRGQEIVGLIEQAVAEAGSYEYGQKDIQEQAAEIVLLDILLLEHTFNNIVAQQEGDKEAHGIPTQAKRAYVEYHRVYVPVYS